MSKKSVAKNYLYNVLYQIITMIIPLITTPYLSRVLGAENIGIYSYTLSITTYFILFGSLGVAMYGQREIAYLQKDKEKRSVSFFEIFLLKFITLTFSMIIFYFTFCVHGEYSFYYKILILEIFANIIDISWFFQGLEEFKKTISRNIIVKLISIICIFLFVKTENDLKIYFMIYVFSTFLGNFSLWIYLPRFIMKISLRKINLIRHIKPTLVLFIPQIATQVYTVLDKTMIGSIVINKSEVGYYEQAQKIIKLLTTLSTSLGTVLMPRIANLFANGEKEKLKQYLYKSLSIILMLTFPLMFGISSVAFKFVPLFYGPGYEKVAKLIIIISPIIIALGLSNFMGIQLLLPTKRQKEFTISVIVGAFVNFILNLILIPKFESIGASIATIFAEFSVVLVQLYLVKDDFSIKLIFKLSYKFMLSGIIMFLISFYISSLITNNMVSLIIQFIVSVIVYFSLLFIIKEKTFLDILYMCKNKKRNIVTN